MGIQYSSSDDDLQFGIATNGFDETQALAEQQRRDIVSQNVKSDLGNGVVGNSSAVVTSHASANISQGDYLFIDDAGGVTNQSRTEAGRGAGRGAPRVFIGYAASSAKAGQDVDIVYVDAATPADPTAKIKESYPTVGKGAKGSAVSPAVRAKIAGIEAESKATVGGTGLKFGETDLLFGIEGADVDYKISFPPNFEYGLPQSYRIIANPNEFLQIKLIYVNGDTVEVRSFTGKLKQRHRDEARRVEVVYVQPAHLTGVRKRVRFIPKVPKERVRAKLTRRG